MTDRIRTLRVVHPDERTSAPRTEREILVDLRNSAAELRLALARYDQGVAEWADYWSARLHETG